MVNQGSHDLINILLVDDREENLFSLEALLNADEYNFLKCLKGEDALAVAIKSELALILLDVQMPGMDGFEVARLLKNNKKTQDIPIIFVTALSQDQNYVLEGFDVGAVDYLFKPLNPAITKAKVKVFIELYKKQREIVKKNQQLNDARELIEKSNSKLQSAQMELIELNNQLEERVVERTAELETARMELEKSNEGLKKINQDLDNFVYIASHDLKAPISNIEGIVLSIIPELPTENENLHLLVSMIEKSVERFKNTINELTNVSRLQYENSDVENIDIKSIVREVKDTIKDLIKDSNVYIVENYEVDHINFSVKNFRSIIYNLLSNAIKYQDPERKPEIKVTMSRVDANYLLLSVQDNGLGIRQEDREKVFLMFMRLHVHVEGIGVGMSIVKKIVDNANGKIEIESEVGKGSTFKVYFKNPA